MQLQNQTILITGGSSGIGLELTQRLVKRGNTLIICGRSAEKLNQVQQSLPSVHTFQCDLSSESERLKLFNWVVEHHPDCNILINNAAVVSKTDFRNDQQMLEKAGLEIATNLMAPIALSKLFLPMLEQNQHAAIINITTGLIYAPRAVYPIYNATKAALHSFTQVLRHQLKELPVKVIEVMMPAVNTSWHKGDVPKIAISPQRAVGEMIAKIEAGEQEVKVARVKLLYLLSRIAPGLAFKMMNRI